MMWEYNKAIINKKITLYSANEKPIDSIVLFYFPLKMLPLD